MSLTWSCRLSVAEYAALARKAPAPRMACPACAQPMAFDGSYLRLVREAGTVQRIFVHRAHCGRCGRSEALLPHFVVRRRHDSVSSIGAAVLARHGVELPADAAELYRSVPQRTVRSRHASASASEPRSCGRVSRPSRSSGAGGCPSRPSTPTRALPGRSRRWGTCGERLETGGVSICRLRGRLRTSSSAAGCSRPA